MDLEQFNTPAWCIQLALERISFPGEAWDIMDPCCGSGTIVKEVARHYPMRRVTGFDIDATLRPGWETRPETLGYCSVRDALSPEPWPWESTCRMVVTNPPFSLAVPFLLRCFEEVGGGRKSGTHVLALLRLGFLGSMKRRVFWEFHQPADVFVLPKRPAFRANSQGKPGNDYAEYAWFHWNPRASNRWARLELEPKKRGGK